MKPIQAEIIIKNGRIASINPAENKVTIKNEKSKFTFMNSWLYPGFVDTHGHVFGLGQFLEGLNLNNAGSEEECIEQCLKYNKYRENWLVGRGWNQELWNHKSYPSKKTLDSVFKNIPVYLTRVDGHAAWVNSKALKLAGINKNTPDPPGGKILRENNGELTGLLIDNAMYLVSDEIPDFPDESVDEMILSACDELLRNGITEIHDMDVSPDILTYFIDLDIAGKIPIRIQSFLETKNKKNWIYKKKEKSGLFNQNSSVTKRNPSMYYGNKLNVTGLKFYMDGALGSRGAALLDDYSDKPGEKGLLLLDQEKFYNRIKKGIENGYGIAIHAIGDKANRICLRTYEQIFKDKIAGVDDLLRIEHAQIVHPDDLEYFSKYDICAALQPVHCLSDAPMARKRLGDRISLRYPWKSLLKYTNRIGGGSDFPIESHNPLTGISALCSRIPFNENEPWIPEEIIGIEDALDLYTKNAHILSQNNDRRGEIEIGNDADFTILNQNLTKINTKKILESKVEAVFVNGKNVAENLITKKHLSTT